MLRRRPGIFYFNFTRQYHIYLWLGLPALRWALLVPCLCAALAYLAVSRAVWMARPNRSRTKPTNRKVQAGGHFGLAFKDLGALKRASGLSTSRSRMNWIEQGLAAQSHEYA
jgi:hypothetical protein